MQPTSETAAEPFLVRPEVADGLRRLDAGLAAVLLAALDVVLLRYTGQADIVVGVPAANGYGGIVLPIRANCAGNPAFRDLLSRVRGALDEAYAYAEVPADRLARVLGGPIPVLFALGAATEPPDICPDLRLTVAEDGRELRGRLDYRTELFDAATAARLVASLSAVLAAAVEEPARPIRQIDVLSPAERRRTTVEWNDTAVAGDDAPVTRLVAEQARRTPDRVAVVCAGRRLTYAELAAHSSRLAHHLRDLGVGPGSVVGLCLDRGPAAVIGLLGILKAGAAYVPLDPVHPPARLRFLATDAGAELVVTRAALAGRLAGVRPVLVDTDRAAIAGRPADDPELEPGPDELAYVIYTSGSTGTPKGVEVTHRGVTNLLRALAPRYAGADGRSDFLASTVLTFDISVLELFAPLITGGTVTLTAGNGVDDVEDWTPPTAGQAVQTVPAKWELLLNAPGAELAGLRCVVGGEALNRHLADRLFDAFGPFTNAYGPTETTIWSLTHDFTEPPGDVVPIGRPLANTRVYVVDGDGAVLPVGVRGELLIGGAGVARGYRGRPGLTARRFVPDGFSGEPGARLYRTGDLVRWRADGTLEFLGRLDQQVKIGGHRIEPAEVEAALTRHPAVAAAAVAVREDRPGERRLVGFVVPVAGGVPAAGLRAFLAETLPSHLVPPVLAEVPDLPRLANGKVDRTALTKLDLGAGRLSADVDFVAPADPVEEIIAGIWCELLGVEKVGGLDDFFVLGGHSLLVTRLMSRLREAFGVELAFGVVFEAPTVAALAKVIRAGQGSGGGVLPAVPAVPRDGELPLSFAQQRLRFLDQLIPDNPFYNMPFTYRIRGPLDVGALRAALNRVVARHETLRTIFPVTAGGRMVQVVTPAAPVELPVVPVAEEEVADRVAQWSLRPFDLASGPVLRGCLLRPGAEDHVLVLVMHHLVADGWSAGVLTRELDALYTAFRDGAPDPLPPLPVQYGDYAVWQRGWLTGEALDTQLRYWRDKLRGLPGGLTLPADRERPPVPAYRGGVRSFAIDSELTGRLRAVAQAEHATLYMVLLTAFTALLARYTGQSDVAIGAPVANRRRPELEPIIGFFANTLVLRTDCAGNPSFRELLGRVRETTLGAFTHQDIPFEQLVDELGVPRDLSRNPLVQVVFQMRNVPWTMPRFGGLDVAPQEGAHRYTRFDLEMHLVEAAGGLRGLCVYDRELFDAGTVARWIDAFLNLLTHVAAVAVPYGAE